MYNDLTNELSQNFIELRIIYNILVDIIKFLLDRLEDEHLGLKSFYEKLIEEKWNIDIKRL